MRIKKAVFPVAGLGTRFLPATKANPKEMMPIVDKPLIQFAVEEALEAGITDLIFVTSSSKRAIEDHFDHNFELEITLQQRNEHALLEILDKILPKGVSCVYVRQPKPLGLGHAILCAKNIIGQDPFAVLLADDLIEHAQTGPKRGQGCLQQMVERFIEVQSTIVGVQKIAKEDCDKYGIVGFRTPMNDVFSEVHTIVEKPGKLHAPSQFGVVGRYILTNSIIACLEKLSPGKNAEIQLTDAIAGLLNIESVFSLEFTGRRFDCGSKLGYLQAIVAYGCNHAEVGRQFREHLASFAAIPDVLDVQ